jgi:hypothetical protein
MQRKPMWVVEVSIASPCRAAGRPRRQWLGAQRWEPPLMALLKLLWLSSGRDLRVWDGRW